MIIVILIIVVVAVFAIQAFVAYMKKNDNDAIAAGKEAHRQEQARRDARRAELKAQEKSAALSEQKRQREQNWERIQREQLQKQREQLQKQQEAEERLQKIEQSRLEKVKQFHIDAFPVSTENEPIQQEWNYWDATIHNEESQVKLQDLARFKTIPVLIEQASLSGFFYESHYNSPAQLYNTTLNRCTCEDFRSQKKPCIHIYRLFFELTQPGSRNALIADVDENVISRFKSLCEDGKVDFISLCGRYRGQPRLRSELLKSEVAAGLISISDYTNYDSSIKKTTKDQLIIELNNHGIDGARPSWSKVKLVNWIANEHPEFFKELFGDYVTVSINSDVQDWAKGIQASFNSYQSYPLNTYFNNSRL